MKINLYDFDKTIYDGDSSIDFYLFCFIGMRPPLLSRAPCCRGPPAVEGLLLSMASVDEGSSFCQGVSPIRGLRLIASRASAYRVGVSMRPLSPM
mgnify:CR=1 FL=1